MCYAIYFPSNSLIVSFVRIGQGRNEGGRKVISSTEWTQQSVASRSLWCSRLPPSPYPPCICPLIPDVGVDTHTMGPTPNLVSDSRQGMLLSLHPSTFRQSLCGAPVRQHSTAPSWLWSTPICSPAPWAATASHAWEGLLTVLWRHQAFPCKATFLSLVVRHMQGAAGAGAGASDPERASGIRLISPSKPFM